MDIQKSLFLFFEILFLCVFLMWLGCGDTHHHHYECPDEDSEEQGDDQQDNQLDDTANQAEDSFPSRDERKFRSIKAGGVTVPNHEEYCSGSDTNLAMEDSGAIIELALMDYSGEEEDKFYFPIKKGSQLDGLDSGVDLTPDNISADRGRLFSVPDVECNDDGDCPSGMACQPLRDYDGNRCSLDTSINTDFIEPAFIGGEHDLHAIAFMVSSVGRWRGRYSQDFEDLYEFVDDGLNESMSDSTLNTVAIDRQDRRLNGAQRMVESWGNLQSYVRNEGRESLFSFFTFGESVDDTVSRVDENDLWADDKEEVLESIFGMPSSGNGRSNVYQGMVDTLKMAFEHPDVAEADQRTLVLMVGGYDEKKSKRMEDVIDAANDRGVEVTIVQIDPELDDPADLRLDPHYYDGQSPCSQDSDCKNFEYCGEPVPYTYDVETNDPDDIDYPEERGTNYCIPDYDDEGRIGPIRDYAEIACATGGAYHYLSNMHQRPLGDWMSSQIWIPEAGWSIGFDIENLDPLDTQSKVLIAMDMELSLYRDQKKVFGVGDYGLDRRRVVFLDY